MYASNMSTGTSFTKIDVTAFNPVPCTIIYCARLALSIASLRSVTVDTFATLKGAIASSSSEQDENAPHPNIAKTNKVYFNVFIVSSFKFIQNTHYQPGLLESILSLALTSLIGSG